MIDRETLTLADGLQVTIKAPGIGLELDAAREIPQYAAFRKRLDEADPALHEDRLGDCFTFSCLLIEHGTESPRMRREPRAGELAIGDLVDVDFIELSGAIGRLLAARRRRGMDHYRPIWAARAENGSAPPLQSAGASDAGRAKSSG